MNRRDGLAAALAAAIACAGAMVGMLGMAATASERGPDPTEPNSIEQEPVVVYEIAGFGLGGPIHYRMTVYSDGLVSYSSASIGDDGYACFVFAGVDAARMLRRDLVDAGAFELGDVQIIGADIPLTTVTVFQPAGDGWSRAKTFSYGIALDGSHQTVTAILEDFIDAHLPAVCGNNGTG